MRGPADRLGCTAGNCVCYFFNISSMSTSAQPALVAARKCATLLYVYRMLNIYGAYYVGDVREVIACDMEVMLFRVITFAC